MLNYRIFRSKQPNDGLLLVVFYRKSSTTTYWNCYMLFRFSFSNISQHILEDSETIFKRLCRALGHLINSFYYNLLIKALELIKNGLLEMLKFVLKQDLMLLKVYIK